MPVGTSSPLSDGLFPALPLGQLPTGRAWVAVEGLDGALWAAERMREALLERDGDDPTAGDGEAPTF